MRGHWPGHVDCRRLGLGVQGADQGVLGHLPVLVGFLLGGQAGVDLPERELPVVPEGPPEDTEGRRRPKVQGRPGGLLEMLMGRENWGRGC